jgi:hypothetical protein
VKKLTVEEAKEVVKQMEIAEFKRKAALIGACYENPELVEFEGESEYDDEGGYNLKLSSLWIRAGKIKPQAYLDLRLAVAKELEAKRPYWTWRDSAYDWLPEEIEDMFDKEGNREMFDFLELWRMPVTSIEHKIGDPIPEINLYTDEVAA